MEGHHLIRCTAEIAERIIKQFGVNIDTEENIISLCPNCHRIIHYGIKEDKIKIIEKLFRLQSEKWKKINLNISLEELKKMYIV